VQRTQLDSPKPPPEKRALRRAVNPNSSRRRPEKNSSGDSARPRAAGELFKTMAGVNLMHVPYRGTESNHDRDRDLSCGLRRENRMDLMTEHVIVTDADGIRTG
jgi:hypothetical protein